MAEAGGQGGHTPTQILAEEGVARQRGCRITTRDLLNGVLFQDPEMALAAGFAVRQQKRFSDKPRNSCYAMLY